MDSYLPKDATAEAQAIARRFASLTGSVAHDAVYGAVTPRALLSVHPAASGGWGWDRLAPVLMRLAPCAMRAALERVLKLLLPAKV